MGTLAKSEKRCSKCRKLKPVDQFGVARKSKDGLRWACRPCTRSSNAKWYREISASSKQKRVEASREYYRSTDGRIKNLVATARARCKKTGTAFSLSAAWVKSAALQRQCAVTGVMFDYGPDGDGTRRNPFAPSIDRINSNEGYTDENTRLVCVWYNLAKQDWSDDRMRMIVSAVAPGILH